MTPGRDRSWAAALAEQKLISPPNIKIASDLLSSTGPPSDAVVRSEKEIVASKLSCIK
jgi:hypothetical protein